MRGARRRGAEFVLVSPLRDDLAAELGAQWLDVVPGTDAALLLAMCHVLRAEGLHDTEFLRRCTAGSEEFLATLDPFTPEWAQEITGIPAQTVRDLARRAVRGRTMVTVSWSVARTRFGEQPLWAAVAFAAMVGQIGLPGGGFGHGYASTGGVGKRAGSYPLPTFPQFADPLRVRIPVARIADALLHPGEEYDVDGRRETYPHLRLVHWAGGNPFHHHQDLTRLQRAFRAAETVVVHEPFWTATARHADVVFASTTTLERNDIGAARYDDRLIAMGRVHEPLGQARDDYDVLAELSQRLGTGERFTEGRTGEEWVEHLWEEWRTGPAARSGIDAPSYAEFVAAGEFVLPPEPAEKVMFASFRADPETFPLRTPSGRVELHSETVAGFGYDDCPGHPVWLEPEEVPDAEFPLHLVANNRRRACTASSTTAPRRRRGRSPAANPSGCTPTTPPPAGWAPVRSSCCAAAGAVASVGSCCPTPSAAASCRCPRAPGSTPSPARPRASRAGTGTSTSSPATSARRAWRRPAPASTRPSR